MFQWVLDEEKKPWKRWALLGFLGFAALALAIKWSGIGDLMLLDTDDNLRMAQVRDWMAGQGWYDLRQYRMEPPEGIDVHWSRLPDLPIAGLIWLLSPLLGTGMAEKVAAALAPLIPGVIIFFSVALVTRRVAARGAWPIAMVAVLMATGLGSNLMPLRIDHHGWQLAMLSISMVGFTDPRAARGGAIIGLAIAGSLAIGLEMIIFLALMGVATVIGWIFFVGERLRVIALGATAAGAMGPAYLVFASEANRGAVCDALSTVWLADTLVGGALLVLIAWRAPHDWRWRLGLAAVAGLALVAFHASAFPHCLSRLEGVSDEANLMWLSRVHEAKSVMDQSWALIARSLPVPITGIVGYVLLARRGGMARRRMAVAFGVAAFVAFALIFWQARMVGAAQLLAIPGAAGFLVTMLPRLEASSSPAVRVLGISLAFLLSTGALPVLVADYLPGENRKGARVDGNEDQKAETAAAKGCRAPEALADLAALPPGHVYTFIDMAPRILVMTPHSSVTGPYHRNHKAIVENLKTLRGAPDESRAVIVGSGADYLFICKSQMDAIGRDGLAGMLEKGEAVDWLEPIEQSKPAASLSLLYRVTGPGRTG